MKAITAAAVARHRRDLLEVTAIPTATGREDRVAAWVRAWCRLRKVGVRTDRYGNLWLTPPDATRTTRPWVLSAHLDHPAFVVTAAEGRRVTAEFRGGVADAYFENAKVRLWRGGATHAADGRGVPGRVTELRPADPREPGSFKTATLTFTRDPAAEPGDFATWDLGGSVVRKTGANAELHTPVCDNLAGLAAGLAAFGELIRRGAARRTRFLCTRAEEVGFVGAVGAIDSGLLPAGARMVVLENSKASGDAPQGGGPVVRVGDATSTFTPELTAELAAAGRALAAADAGFAWQRKLMTGGTCEASAYAAWGMAAACVCLPLGNYHNMDEGRGVIAREFIRLSDFDGLVRLLVAAGERAAHGGGHGEPSLRGRLEALFAARRGVLWGVETRRGGP